MHSDLRPIAIWISRLTAGVALAACGLARADMPNNMTAGEVALLPPYCADTFSFTQQWVQDNPTERQRYWVSFMGRTFWAVHHYCWALMNERRALAAGVTPLQREFLLTSALTDSSYVIRNATPDFVLLPEIYTKMGDFNMRMGRLPQALQLFDRAREVKPDYWPPYARLAELHESVGQKRTARKVLAEGLAQLPDEPNLLEPYKRLGGDTDQLPHVSPAASAASSAG